MLVPTHAKIYLYNEITDMRKSINTLSMLIADVFDLDPCSGHLFLFRNRRGDKLKALYYEQNAFTLWYRRLEKSAPILEKIHKWLKKSIIATSPASTLGKGIAYMLN